MAILNIFTIVIAALSLSAAAPAPNNNEEFTTQQNPPWSLSSISSQTQGLKPYRYDESAGKDTFAYIIDSGINANHVEFGGRATLGYNADGNNPVPDTGHGTLVAGLIGSNTYGVAKKTNIIGVQAVRPQNMLDGFMWAVEDIKKKGRVGRSVINISQGFLEMLGPNTESVGSDLGQAISFAFEVEGILTILAAGNDGKTVEKGNTPYPALMAPYALVVGAIDDKWNMWDRSNYGKHVDIFAPGVDLTSTDIGSNTATRVASGTSFAAPHVAGLALYLAAAENITTASDLRARVLDLATKDKITNLKGDTVNLLAYNGA
ncbi:hypothetical protein MHUMG1_09620 [Metarhizium humberi]|uniref:Peptidase S8/S53 domain-containing protein n=1 Tax=Metarhizium humberi TaxID=2596975 RepID=A0A9P8M481_9HYPO|nr:hypothetical protein MHUMG1_09620 [Metarhizium humberi]